MVESVSAASGTSQKHPACISCSRAKRRCTKQLPACVRCRGKRQRCIYPMTRIILTSSDSVTPQASAAAATAAATPDFEIISSDGGIVTPPVDETTTTSPTVPSEAYNELRSPRWLQENSSTPGTIQGTSVFVAPSAVGQQRLDNLWFLTPISWQIFPSPENANDIFLLNTGFNHFITKLRGWLDQWIEQAHCPLIHPRLYQAGTQLPDCLRDAYAAYQTYRTATPSNKHVALQIVSQSAKRLTDNQALFDDLHPNALDIESHMSRTQALLVYQVLRLFDGDIRLRADAEAASDTLLRWSNQLMQNAASIIAANANDQDYGIAMNDVSQQHNTKTKSFLGGDPKLWSDGTISSAWRAWIISECIRRTWITATLTEAAYAILKRGASDCPGTISFTSRAGLWQATSPRQWLSHLQGVEGRENSLPIDYGFPSTCAEVPSIVTRARPEHVDEFAHALVIYGMGLDRWNDWKADYQERATQSQEDQPNVGKRG